MPKLPRERAIAYVFMLVNASLWGFASPIIKYSLQFTNPITFLFYRYVLASIIFIPIIIIFLQKKTFVLNFKRLLLLSLLGTPLTLLPLFYGLELTSSIDASILVSTSPVFTILGGLIFLKEVIKPKEWLGFSLALLGTILLTLDPLLSGGSQPGHSSISGNILILLSNIIWTLFLLLSKKNHLEPVILSFFSFLVSIPFFLVTALLTQTNLTLPLQALPGISYMAIFGSIIAFLAYQEGQKRIEASEAAMFTYLQPLFALPLALLWLHEPMTPLSIFSLIIILIGVFVA